MATLTVKVEYTIEDANKRNLDLIAALIDERKKLTLTESGVLSIWDFDPDEKVVAPVEVSS